MKRDQRERDLVLEALRAGRVDSADFGRFVNRPTPGVIESSSFDSTAATPVLLEWLPKVTDNALKIAIIGHLRNPAAKDIATEPLIREFKGADDETVRWQAGDALQYVATAQQRPQLIPLARDKRYGKSRQMLFDAIGRLKSGDAVRVAEESLTDPDVALHAGSAYRRLVDGDRAESVLQGLAENPDAAVARAAKMNLKRLSRSPTMRG